MDLNKEEKRLAKLASLHIMDTESEDFFDEISLLASSICNTPIALVSLVDDRRQWFKAKIGLEVSETPRNISFCEHAIEQELVFEIEDALKDDRFKNNPLVLSDPNIRFYAGAPLKTVEGYNLGTLCVIDRVPKKLTEEQKSSLKLLAQSVVNQFELQRQNRLLEKEKVFLNAISTIQSSVNYNLPPNAIFAKLLDVMLEGLDSAYGFIGEIKHDGTQNFLKTHAITNIAWTEELQKFYKDNAPNGLEFKNLKTLFGKTIETGEPVIANDPYNDPRRGGLPEGHPYMGAYLGVPIKNFSGTIGMIGVANKPGGYSQEDIDFIQPFLSACSSLITGYNSFAEWKRTERLVEFKSDFLAHMSHEIRTPLNGIVGSLDAYFRMEDEEKKSQLLNIMRTSSSDLLNIVNDVLNLSKLEAGKVDIIPSVCSIKKIFEDTISLYASKAQEKDLKLNYKFNVKVPSQIKIDDSKLKQILNNLVSNAIKFTEKGEVILCLAGIRDKELFITVSDTGIGIKPKDIDKIFLRYEQSELASFKKKIDGVRGTGLGLSISKKLVELLGGKLVANSIFTEGSVFTFNIKYEEVENNQLQENEVISRSSYDGLSVLLVEDIKANQIVAKLMLESFGMHVVLADNGEQGIFKYKEDPGKYDIILMDIQMPVLDGATATKELLKLYGNDMCPIIGLSANAMEGDINKYIEMGMTGYIPKPLTKDKLLEEIDKLNL